MGVVTKGIVIGRQDVSAVAAIVRQLIGGGQIDIRHFQGVEGFYRLGFEHKGDRRSMAVFLDSIDHRDVFDGERTYVDLGASGASVEIIEHVLKHFGGWLLERDSDEGSPWRFIEPAIELELSPLDELKVTLGKTLTIDQAAALRQIADDPDKLDQVIAAFHEYERRRPTLEAAP